MTSWSRVVFFEKLALHWLLFSLVTPTLLTKSQSVYQFPELLVVSKDCIHHVGLIFCATIVSNLLPI